MDYMSMIDRAIFAENMIKEEQDMEDYISECLIFSGTDRKYVFKELSAFNEGKATDRIKGIFTRVKTFVAGIFKKFTEKLNNWSLNEKQYLEKYKDIIIGKKVKIDSVTMYNHFDGMKRINEILDKSDKFGLVPSDKFYEALSQNSIRGAAPDSKLDKDQFPIALRQKLMDDLGIGSNGIRISDNIDYKVECKNFFYGSEKEMKFTGSQLNMEVIFNALYQYKTIYNGLDSMQKNFEQSLSKIEQKYNTEYTKTANELKLNPKNKPIKDINRDADYDNDDIANHMKFNLIHTASSNQSAAKTDSTPVKESYIFSRVYGDSIFNEFNIDTTSNNNRNNSAKNDSVDIENAKKANENRDKSMDNINNKVGGSDDEKKSGVYATVDAISDKNDSIDLDAYTTTASLYFQEYTKARTILFGAMLTALESMRNDYMQIVRAHVNSYLAKVPDSSDNTGKSSVSSSATTTTTKAQTRVVT